MELWDTTLTLPRMDLELVEVIEECPFALSLASKDEDVVVDDAAGVTVTALGHGARLSALDPTKEFKLLPRATPQRVLSVRNSL